MHRVKSQPIIIGGNGGSGTRVVAEVLIRMGVYLGQDLNPENDNLVFTYFFKHPKRFIEDSGADNIGFDRLFALHEKLLLGGFPASVRDFWLMLFYGWEHAHNRYSWSWVFNRWRKVILSKHNIAPEFWGWKEPHVIFHLRGIKKYYPHAKYIHVIRHGLDMVYSKNQQQLKNWGRFFDLDTKDLSQRNRFEFWYRSNKQIIESANKFFGDHVHIIKLEELCLASEETIKKLLGFIGINFYEVSPEIIEIPKLPKSYRRYLHNNADWVDSMIRRKLLELGYDFVSTR